MHAKKLVFIFLFISISFGQLPAQFTLADFPLNINQAYQKGTRSMDGKPGPQYWLNHAKYDIKVTLVPAKFLLKGQAEITYKNNSPDSLDKIVMRLYPNFYQKGAKRDIALSAKDVHDGLMITHLAVDDQVIDVDLDETATKTKGTNFSIFLNEMLVPDAEIDIRISWRYNLPRETPVRTGAYSDSAFFMAYWYPQIAVYDDIDGWDMINYNGTAEYYNDFHDFSVEITAPYDYLIMATGELQNPEDILSQSALMRLQDAKTSDAVIAVVDRTNLTEMSHVKDAPFHTWKFVAEYVPDFAFAAAKGFLWDATSALVQPKEGRRVLVNTLYPPDSPDFAEVAQISKDILEYMSQKFPAIPYPYPVMSAFNRPGRNNGGGMEFPMIISDGSHTTRSKTTSLTIHEIAHTYFPFYMGTNERKYAFMDEGWATMFPYIILPHLEPTSDPLAYSLKTYEAWAGREDELAPMIPSHLISGGPAYRIAAYTRPALAYYFLRDALGADVFDQALKEFIQRWNGKHPIPYDFFFTFNKVAGEDLSWYWRPWFFEHGYPDLAVKDVKIIDQSVRVNVEKAGKLPVPLQITAYFADATQQEQYFPASVWKDKDSISIEFSSTSTLTKLELGNARIPDVNRDNDIYTP